MRDPASAELAQLYRSPGSFNVEQPPNFQTAHEPIPCFVSLLFLFCLKNFKSGGTRSFSCKSPRLQATQTWRFGRRSTSPSSSGVSLSWQDSLLKLTPELD